MHIIGYILGILGFLALSYGFAYLFNTELNSWAKSILWVLITYASVGILVGFVALVLWLITS